MQGIVKVIITQVSDLSKIKEIFIKYKSQRMIVGSRKSVSSVLELSDSHGKTEN